MLQCLIVRCLVCFAAFPDICTNNLNIIKMKTKNLISVVAQTALLVVLLFSQYSCANSNQKTNAVENYTEVVKPATDIHTAVFMGNINAVMQHIKAGSDLNKRDAYGSTPLNVAITFGKTDIAVLLIEGGADINATNADGSTPLHTAAFFCRSEIVGELLNNNADITLKNKYGSTALESVSANFNDIKPIYKQIAKDLGPLGLRLDLERIELTRPVIVEMLSEKK